MNNVIFLPQMSMFIFMVKKEKQKLKYIFCLHKYGNIHKYFLSSKNWNVLVLGLEKGSNIWTYVHCFITLVICINDTKNVICTSVICIIDVKNHHRRFEFTWIYVWAKKWHYFNFVRMKNLLKSLLAIFFPECVKCWQIRPRKMEIQILVPESGNIMTNPSIR